MDFDSRASYRRQILHDLGRDFFTGNEYGDAWGIRNDGFSADFSGGFWDGDAGFSCKECVSWHEHLPSHWRGLQCENV